MLILSKDDLVGLIPARKVIAAVESALRSQDAGSGNTSEEISSIGIVGSGMQDAWQASYTCATRPIKEVVVFSRSTASFKQLSA